MRGATGGGPSRRDAVTFDRRERGSLPGSGHVDAEGYEETATIVRMTPEATCLPCHNEEHSDHFNYRNYLPRILGPGHGQPLPAKAR